MKYYRTKNKSTESICVDKITKGIQSINKGTRSGESVGKDLEFFFSKLEECNEPMYQEMYMKYCTARLNAVKGSKQVKEFKRMHS
jgi:hypothetical protein